MAKKTASTNPKHLGLTCKDCRHSYEPHSPAIDGHMILCRCPYFEFSKFLNRDCCDKFSMK